jgi:uncharacterized protein (DUF1778 family)
MARIKDKDRNAFTLRFSTDHERAKRQAKLIKDALKKTDQTKNEFFLTAALEKAAKVVGRDT